MIAFWKRLYYAYLLRHHAIPFLLWENVTQDLPAIAALSPVENARLRELSSLFLYQKELSGKNIQLTDTMRVIIASYACLPILNLGFDHLKGWTTVLVYGDAFYVSRDEMDSQGLVHYKEAVLSGEAWLQGPVILAWETIQQDLQNPERGQNVIIHEIAHKLDMSNGKANGMPALHLDMPVRNWTDSFSKAYASMQKRYAHHRHICLNPYALTAPAEFFAVCSESFFCTPERLYQNVPDIYRQLCLYYRQDPLSHLKR